MRLIDHLIGHYFMLFCLVLQRIPMSAPSNPGGSAVEPGQVLHSLSRSRLESEHGEYVPPAYCMF